MGLDFDFTSVSSSTVIVENKKIELNYFSNTYVLRNNIEFRSLAEFKDKQAFDIYLETTKNSKFCHKLYQCQRIYTGGNTLELRYLNISDC